MSDDFKHTAAAYGYGGSQIEPGQRESEDVDRRMHWLRLARELGQEDDFKALLNDVRREALTVALGIAQAGVEKIEIGAGSEHYRHGRETMRDDVLAMFRDQP